MFQKSFSIYMATVRYNFTWLKIFSLTHSPHNASHVDVVHLYWVNPINSLRNDLQAQQNILPYSLDKVLAFRKNHLQQPVYQCWCNQIGRSATVFGQMSEIQLLCKHGNWELGKGNKIFSVCFV